MKGMSFLLQNIYIIIGFLKHCRYQSRPRCLRDMWLAQFATHYQTSTKFPKGVTIEDGHSKNLMSEMKIYERDELATASIQT